MVEHSHDNIDASFSRRSIKLHEENFPTILFLIKLYVDLDNISVIPQMIEEIPNFKAFIKPYMLKGMDCLVGHRKT